MKILVSILVIILMLTACSNLSIKKIENKNVTFVSLLNEMTDLKSLMEVPAPDYKCVQFSSYDRKSTDPNNKSDTNWFANGDMGQYIRVETNNGSVEYVMTDVDGPGAVVRIWSAVADAEETIKIYLDNSDKPEIEMPMNELLYGKNKLFPPPIAGARGLGRNCYMPIPYAKHCKITLSAKAVYYQVNCRVYENETNVKTFSLKQLEENFDVVKKTMKILNSPEKLLFNPIDKSESKGTIVIKPGNSFVSGNELSKNENEIIYNFECKILKGDEEQTLRGCLLEITFDNMNKKSVQAPLGDFFGTAPGLNKFESLPLGVLDDGTMYCHFLMPFKKKATFKFTNTTTNEISLNFKICSMPYEWTDRSQYFCAKWRTLFNQPTKPRIDWTLFDCKGKGKYVGNMYQISNPVPNWWGEGDEKIYIDDEKFPSTFGTGTEDYYGYAYCWYDTFSHAYHNQSRVDGPANFGHSCVSRFHFLDALTFNKSIKFDMEIWHHISTTVSVASTVYWYERPGAEADFPLIKKEQLVVPKLPELKKISGAIEGEEMIITKISGGKVSRKLTGENGINQQKVLNDTTMLLPCLIAGFQGTSRSTGRALWWIDSKKGDELELEFLSDKEGTNEIFYSGTRGKIFGKFDLFINGEPTKETLDLFAKNIASTGEISLGKFFIKKGPNKIKIVTKEKNKQTDLFVIDYIKMTTTK